MAQAKLAQEKSIFVAFETELLEDRDTVEDQKLPCCDCRSVFNVSLLKSTQNIFLRLRDHVRA